MQKGVCFFLRLGLRMFTPRRKNILPNWYIVLALRHRASINKADTIYRPENRDNTPYVEFALL